MSRETKNDYYLEPRFSGELKRHSWSTSLECPQFSVHSIWSGQCRASINIDGLQVYSGANLIAPRPKYGEYMLGMSKVMIVWLRVWESSKWCPRQRLQLSCRVYSIWEGMGITSSILAQRAIIAKREQRDQDRFLREQDCSETKTIYPPKTGKLKDDFR